MSEEEEKEEGKCSVAGGDDGLDPDAVHDRASFLAFARAKHLLTSPSSVASPAGIA